MDHKPQQGFTLIEMLVAMAIFSTLISVLMMGYRQGLLMWDKGQQQSQAWLDEELRYRLLDTLFTQAVISDDEHRKALFVPYFEGDTTSMRFLSAAPIMDMPGRVRPVMLQAVQHKDNSWTLRYREGERYSDPGRGLRWSATWVDLLDHVSSVSFSFEAPAFPAPDEIRNQLTDADRLVYRDAPVWMAHYSTDASWKYPIHIALSFSDKQGKHQWLFTPPRWPDAWTMAVYSTHE